MSESFSDRLTPGQVQHVYDALELPWREYYNPDNDGWVNVPYHENFDSDLSLNIQHGGWVDQYMAGHPDPMVDDIPIRGDIVTLVTFLKFLSGQENKAIEWIKQVLGMGKGVKPPELQGGYEFTNDWLDNVDGYTRVPDSILHSSLSTSAKLVWIEIFSRINKGQVYSYAGTRDIAKRVGISKPTVLKAIAELKKARLLIEKNRGYNKPPARFPLVADKTTIDDTIMAQKEQESNKQSFAGEETLPGVVKKLNGGGEKTLPELDPLNQTQKNKTQDSYKAKLKNFRRDRGYWCTYSAEQVEALQAFCASIGIAVDELPEPPAKYQKLFIATFADTHKLDRHGMYPLSDNRVFDPSAINVN